MGNKCIVCEKTLGFLGSCSAGRWVSCIVDDAPFKEDEEICFDCLHCVSQIVQKDAAPSDKEEEIKYLKFNENKIAESVATLSNVLNRNKLLTPAYREFLINIATLGQEKIDYYHLYERGLAAAKNKLSEFIFSHSNVPHFNVDENELGTCFVSNDVLYIMPYGAEFLKRLEAIPTTLTKDEKISYSRFFKEEILDKECALEIKLSDILFYEEKGDVDYTQAVTGSGGGVNFDGAIVGAKYCGELGALLGSQYGTEMQIESTLVKHDSRCVVLRYKNEEGKMKEETLPYNYYVAFSQIMPEKNYTVVNFQSNHIANSTSQTKNEQPDYINQIIQLKQLFDAGILTEEEFSAKKKQILGI